uniref:Uncharacterized protein n=1 Tax=Rhizochromulina marina TaxID=1034831 RepID=A0A7S2RHY6_9STRA|mmetsp:Transcript_16636/g.48550  ORF Transcript_16636/g.48550 Transcript_16636/m.48550 type:complete len:118 (+) Transcript_16636:32-385(+)|eukprot:CAMPEP_0118974004 /NCGR_PEP_ID=MMETSP1173-20130426/11024_1 /TAXON_ID=1034831 /ORGANISM="Rhizochromulina marina cf, Strain CCMP1243" /LENGTH=117 /DNA_ID=CAMNT_0006923705 /DNA_START=29 /DNA_END=382 /DNA_ORIENTATION=+
MQSAEALQRERILEFCGKHGLAPPAFGDQVQLAQAISSALDVLDRTRASRSATDASAKLAAMQARVTEAMRESAELRRKVEDAKLQEQQIQAADVIAQVSRLIEADYAKAQSQAGKG